MTDEQEQAEAEAWAKQAFFMAHPKESYETFPDEFLAFCKFKNPAVTHESLREIFQHKGAK